MNKKLVNIEAIEKFLGPVQEVQLRNNDNYIADKIAMFMPITGFCDFAVGAVHAHPSYQFVLPFNDQIAFQIGPRLVPTRPKMLLALSPDLPHKEVLADRFPRYIAIFIDKDFFAEQLSQYPGTHDIFFNGDFIPIQPNLMVTVKEFILEADNQMAGSETVLLAASLKICHIIIRSLLGIRQQNEKISHRWEIDRTIEYMHSNLDKKITVEELAVFANMSLSHYMRIFKKETGQSNISYLNQVRLERVKRLLLEGGKSITEIALECGFSSSAYLSYSFYNKYKMSPTDFQKSFAKR